MQFISQLPPLAWQQQWPRCLAILGSTGSIGTSTLEVVQASQGRLRIIALAGGRNIHLLAQQAERFRPDYLGIQDASDRDTLYRLLPTGYSPSIFCGQEGYETLAALQQADIIVSAQSGAAGLRATVKAAESGKVIALANKESLVIAGELIRSLCTKTGAVILPVDSEHNAIFQCLAGNNPSDVKRLLLTASGGPFYGWSPERLKEVTPAMALKHPNWSMGAKISIDSATLMNKGLEVIEAFHLYGLPLEQIDVLVHRQSIIHSLVEYHDGSQIAQLGTPDMRTAISHCLHWPQRHDCGVPPLDLTRCETLTFASPDTDAFPCLALAKTALRKGGGVPTILNAANEVAVAAFLEERLPFSGIAPTVARALDQCIDNANPMHLPSLLSLDTAARTATHAIVSHFPR